MKYVVSKARRTSGSSRGNNGAVETLLGDDVDLDGGVTAGVVDRAGVDLDDGHFGWYDWILLRKK